MGTIADKLDYLADTKEMLKDRLNSLGAEIIESTTFRNYLNWLDTFYEEVSDKTDLSENGVVGRTSQATVVLPTGYTQVDYIESSGTQYIDTGMQANGNTTDYNIVFAPTRITDYNFILSARINAGERRLDIGWGRSGDIYIGYNNASLVNSALYGALTVNTICNIQKSGTNFYLNGTNIYTISAVNFTTPVNLMIFANNNNGTLTNYAGARLYSLKLYENDTLVRNFVPCYRNSDNEVGLYDIVNNVFYTNQGTGVFTYGSVVSIPNPDYPQPINNLSGDVVYKVKGKNLFDKDNINVLNAYINADENKIIPSSNNKTIYMQLKPNTTYTLSFSKLNSNGGAVNFNTDNSTYTFFSSAPKLNSIGTGSVKFNEATNKMVKTFTTDNTNVYFAIKVVNINSADLSNTLATMMIEQGTTATPYEPYISESFPLSLKSKNLFDISNITENAYINENGNTGSSQVSNLSDYIEVKSNTSYTLSYDYSTLLNLNQRIFVYYDENKICISGWVYLPINKTNTITTPNNAKYIRFSYDKNCYSIMLNEGHTSEPHYDIELCNISDYKDRIYSQNGKFYLEKKNGKVVFDGSENWVYYNTAQGSLFRNNYVDVSIDGISPISNHFIGVNGTGSRYDGTIYYNYYALEAHTTFDILTNKFNNVEDFKTWLSTHNTEVQYPIATPTTTEITQENYPTLYSQLLAIQEFLTKYKINKEFLLDYSSPEIEY